jgi:hypothetical protein
MNQLSDRQVGLISEIEYLKALNLLCKIQKLRTKQIRYGKIRYSGCAVCRSKKQPNIHHLNYKDNQTMLLCRSCHERVHFGEGLEHLNPVGKKNCKNLIEKMPISSDFIQLPRKEESDHIFEGYIKLFKVIFHIRTIENEPIDRVYRIIYD